jgi:lysophospholipid hydrolase
MKTATSIFTQDELFDWTGMSMFESLRSHVRMMKLAPGDTLFREGERGDTFYILLGGRLEAESEQSELLRTEIEPGRAIGETALLTGSPYSATVKATENSSLLAVSRRAFNDLINRHPKIQTYFNEIITPRIHSNYLTKILYELFGNLSAELEQRIQEHVTWQQLQSGDVLFREGDAGDELIIVVTGRLRVSRMQDGQEHIIGEIHQGEMVGEQALLTYEPRSATVKAVRQTDIVRLSRDDFELLVHHQPQALIKITRTIIERQRLTKRRYHEKSSLNFAVLFLHDKDIEFVEALAQKLHSADAPVRVFDAERFDNYYGQSGVAQTTFDNYTSLLVNRWLTEMEVQNDQIFLVADTDWTNWTIRCLQNADRVLLVADGTKSPDLTTIEIHLKQHFPNLRQELLLLHPPATTQPSGTMHWLEHRKVHRHHHIRQKNEQHIARVARLITGSAYGLALSGGGATALAHVGVLQVMEELGIPIDMIGGTSMGAMIGAAVALGKRVTDLKTLIAEFSEPKKIFDLTLPFVALLSTQKLTRLLQNTYGDVHIEDLWIPFFSVSSNLTKSKVEYHTRGLLWHAVRTSASLPVATVPININGNLHVDGAVMNNYPVDIMYELIEGGYVIGVMVSPLPVAEENIDDLQPSVSGWHVLYRRLNPFAKTMQVPPIMNTLFRTLQVNSQYHFKSVAQLADLSIVLHQNFYRFFELEKYQEIIDLGYESAKPQLEAWWHEDIAFSKWRNVRRLLT